MDQNTLFIILMIALLLFLVLRKRVSAMGINQITPADAKKKLDTEKGIVLLDVRSRNEYLAKHIPGSILIPVDTLENEAARRLPDKNVEIIVYCASGSRSVMAAKILTKLGYTHVYNLGGIFSWPYKTVSGN